ncbi:putative ferric-chelate reductase 1 homolog isoform X2 [Branchiostoma lanceolatum]|uniref:putative ferric-chelate reductase 1 homolog isoform X2 n=1 Tax=Branchiostoma lanceolatum TaxID=7740 RepID=UPI003456A64F
MKLLVVAVFLSLAAYAASQTINCFQCEQGAFDSAVGTISGNNDCLRKANDANTSVQTVTCTAAARCYTKIKTFVQVAYAIERGCWSDDDDTCDEEISDDCDGIIKTGTCLRCCNTDRCNKNFAQLDGLLDAVQVTSSGCGSTKGCFQIPAWCAPPSCDYFSSWQTSGDNVLFEISGRSDGYVAVGVSHDELMGLDDIYECVYDSARGITTVFSSWSTGKSMPERDSTLSEGRISAVAGSYVEGVVSCKAAVNMRKRQADLVNSGRIYDLISEFYLLMSKGSTTGNTLAYHASNRVVSPSTVDFQRNTLVNGVSSSHVMSVLALLPVAMAMLL